MFEGMATGSQKSYVPNIQNYFVSLSLLSPQTLQNPFPWLRIVPKFCPFPQGEPLRCYTPKFQKAVQRTNILHNLLSTSIKWATQHFWPAENQGPRRVLHAKEEKITVNEKRQNWQCPSIPVLELPSLGGHRRPCSVCEKSVAVSF